MVHRRPLPSPPPCQPYTRRGLDRDASLLVAKHLLAQYEGAFDGEHTRRRVDQTRDRIAAHRQDRVAASRAAVKEP